MIFYHDHIKPYRLRGMLMSNIIFEILLRHMI